MTINELDMIANKIKTLFALKSELVGIGGHTDAEINALVAQYLIDNPQDTTLTNAQVDDIIEAYFIANPPTDQVRTDVEINALIATYVQNHQELVTTDQEIIDIHNQEASAADALTQEQVDAIIDSIGSGGNAQTLDANSTDPFGDGSLVHFYPLDGSTTDLLSATDIGKIGGIYSAAKFVEGVEFDGVENSVLSIGNSHTISFWVKMDGNTEMNIVDSRSATPSGSSFVYSIAGATTLTFNYPTVYANGVSVTSGAFDTLNDWVHIVIPNVNTGVLFGNYSSSGSHANKFNGLFDHIQVFNRELTQEEITQLFNATPGGVSDNPLLSSIDPFGDGSLDRAYLFEGNGDDLLGNHDIVAPAITGLSYVDGEIVTSLNIAQADLPDIGVGFTNGTQFYATVKAGDVSENLFSFGNGNSATRIYINATTDASGVPQVYIQFRNGSTSGTYWYYNNTVIDPVSVGDKVGIYIEKYISSGTATRIYIDGVLATQSEANGGTTFSEPSGTLHLGAVTGNNDPYTNVPSRLDTLHFFNRSLTEAEIISLQP